jgi:hypothetical protein
MRYFVWMFWVVALAGCHPPGDWKYQYDRPCFYQVLSEVDLEAGELDTTLELVARKYNIAKALYEEEFGESFCDLTQPHILWIHRDVFSMCDTPTGKQACSGFFSPAYGIEVTYDMPAFMHEALHAREWKYGNLTGGHAGWDTNGYYALSDLFTRQTWTLTP